MNLSLLSEMVITNLQIVCKRGDFAGQLNGCG
jgi:hypothetical protein